jgi:hypothetical protein
MEHSRDTCPIPNCPLCQREALSGENKSVWTIPEKAKRALKPVRRWFDPKNVRPMLRLPEPRKVVKPQPAQQYQVREDHDQGFEPCWRSEPVNYTGRGIVYLFHCEADAVDWTNRKNAEALKRK